MPPNPAHKCRFSIALSEEHLRAIEQRADELGVSVSTYLRDTALRVWDYGYLIDEVRPRRMSRDGRGGEPAATRLARRAVVQFSPVQMAAMRQVAKRHKLPLSDLIRRAVDIDAPRWGGVRPAVARASADGAAVESPEPTVES
jgi:hypothetical protein